MELLYGNNFGDSRCCYHSNIYQSLFVIGQCYTSLKYYNTSGLPLAVIIPVVVVIMVLVTVTIAAVVVFFSVRKKTLKK